MTDIYSSPVTEENVSETDIKDKTKIISESVILNLNKLIEDKNEDKILSKLNLLKYLGRKEYSKANTLEEKEKVLRILFINLDKLFNDLNYVKIYNSDSIIGKRTEDFKDNNSLRNMVSIGNDKNIKGASCNNWNYFVIELVKYITNNDKNIDSFFKIRNIDNHGLFYFKLNNQIFLYHYDLFHIFKIHDNLINYNNESYTSYNNKKDYIIKMNNNHFSGIKKNYFSYVFGNKTFELYKENGNIFIKINIGKRIKFIKFFKIIFLKKFYKNLKYKKKIPGKITNIEELKSKIQKKVSPEEYDFIVIALENINKEKLENFFSN